jgi:hypothetical protein
MALCVFRRDISATLARLATPPARHRADAAAALRSDCNIENFFAEQAVAGAFTAVRQRKNARIGAG